MEVIGRIEETTTTTTNRYQNTSQKICPRKNTLSRMTMTRQTLREQVHFMTCIACEAGSSKRCSKTSAYQISVLDVGIHYLFIPQRQT